MYQMILEKAPNFDDSEEIFVSDINDIANSLFEFGIIEQEADFTIIGSIISFDSKLSERQISDRMKRVFSCHWDNVRLAEIK